MKELFSLFLTFAKIGAFTFGGGYAMLPVMSRELVEKRGWITEDDLADYFAIGQCTPGVIAVNTATFVGSKQKGIAGGIFATLGVVFPSIIIISIIAAVLAGFADNPYVIHAFAGIRIAVCALILNSVIKLGKKSVKDWICAVIFAVVAICATVFKLSPIIFVLASAAVGIAVMWRKGAEK